MRSDAWAEGWREDRCSAQQEGLQMVASRRGDDGERGVVIGEAAGGCVGVLEMESVCGW